MLYVLFGVTVAVLVLAIPFASRRRRRVKRAAGGPHARPAPQPAGRAAVPVITDAPDRDERQAFAYGGIVTVEMPDEKDPPPL